MGCTIKNRDKMDRDLATEASWRAGWDPEDKTKDYTGNAVFYHRKHPCYLKFEESQRTQGEALRSIFLIGPEYCDPKYPRPIQKNPYYTPARSTRAGEGMEDEDETLEYKTQKTTLFLIADEQ